MPLRSGTAPEVLLDTSILFRFAELGFVERLYEYLGSRARMTLEVEREVIRRVRLGQFPALSEYVMREGAVARSTGKWPKHTKNLPDSLKSEFTRLLDLKRSIGEHERAHAGEIATVLIAAHRGSALVVMDDDWGSALARRTYGLDVMSTARPTLEMVANGALSEDEGFLVFDRATPDDVGRDRYEAGLRRVRDEVHDGATDP